MKKLLLLACLLYSLPALALNRRENALFKPAPGQTTRPAFSISYTATVYPVGAIVNGTTTGTTLTVRAGHGFIAGQKLIVGTDTTKYRTVSSVTATTVVVSSSVAVSDTDLLVNLGADTGALAPAYDGSPVDIYDTDSISATPISNSRRTSDSQGGYVYWYGGDGAAWELVRDSSGTPVDVIVGSGVAGRFNVRDYGASGDGSTDDTTFIQRALDVASTIGGAVYIPAGRYVTTGPLTVTWTSSPASGLPARPKVTEIFGDGPGGIEINQAAQNGVTEIMCTALAAGRGVIELLGTSNTHATTTKVRDLTIRMRGALNSGGGTTSATAYCIRAGDSTMLHLDNLHLFGANGVALKISSSASYSTIGAKLSRLYVWTNYNSEWFTVNDPAAAVLALAEESGGAFWDTLAIDSCLFFGTTTWRASTALVSNTIFVTNADRNSGYGNNVNLNFGAVHFINTYFEDYRYAISAAGNTAVVRNITCDNCNFVSANNYGTTRSIAAVTIGDGTYGLEQFTMRNSVFSLDTGGHTSGFDVVVTASASKVGDPAHQNTSGLNDLTSGGTYSGTRKYDVFEVVIDAAATPDTFKWRKLYTSTGYTTGVAITGAAQTLSDGVTVTFAATTGHTLSNSWLIPVGFGGPRNIVIEDSSFTSKYAESYQSAAVRVSFASDYAGNYFIRHNDGRIEARGEYARGLSYTHNQDTTALTPGASDGGIELQNLNSATSSSEGGDTCIAGRGIYQNPGSRHSGICFRVDGRNTTTQRESGVILFATKDSTADTLTERGRFTGSGMYRIEYAFDQGTFDAFTSLDTSPSVSGSTLFKTANAGATVITAFDDAVQGQYIVVLVDDANTDFDCTGTTIKCNGGADWTAATTGDHMACWFDGTNWRCTITDNTP